MPLMSRGRRGNTIVPNWWWEDQRVDTFDLRVAGWLASHADSYLAEYVNRNEIARRTGISGERVTRSLRKLIALGLIEVEETPGRSGRARWVVTFDWDVWQTPPAGWQPLVAPQPSKIAEQPIKDAPQPSTPPTPPYGEEQPEQQGEPLTLYNGSESEPAPSFGAFWLAYPRHDGKAEAMKAWTRAVKSTPVNTIIEGLRARVTWWNLSGTEPKFIPHAATWLNQRRWEDELGPIQRPANRHQRPGVMAQLERVRAQRAADGR